MTSHSAKDADRDDQRQAAETMRAVRERCVWSQRITHEDHPGLAVTLPSTPSDHRWAQNTIAEVRAVFGIDLRQPAPGR